MNKKEFLNDHAQCQELSKAVLKQMGATWKEVWENPSDFRDAGAGVSGFIYYAETHEFYVKNQKLIDNCIMDYIEMTGIEFKTENLLDKNWKSWFALETTIDEVMNAKEI